jgi:hypothetical protein
MERSKDHTYICHVCNTSLRMMHEVAWGVVGKPSRTPNMHNHGTIKGPRIYMSCLQYFFEDDALLRVMHVEEKTRVRSCLGNIFLEDRACEPLVGHVASRVLVELLVTDQAIHTRGTLNSSSIHLSHQDSLLYSQFFRTHPSSISSSIYCGAHLSLYLNIFM